MKVIETISIAELSEMSQKMYGNLVKAVVNIKEDILVVDAEMHADLEQYLLQQGSKQNDLWGHKPLPCKIWG